MASISSGLARAEVSVLLHDAVDTVRAAAVASLGRTGQEDPAGAGWMYASDLARATEAR